MSDMDEEALDQFIESSARLLDLPLDIEWLPAIKANLRVTLALASDVSCVPLSDEAEPASVFEA